MLSKKKGGNVFCVTGLQVQGIASSSTSKKKDSVSSSSEDGTGMCNLFKNVDDVEMCSPSSPAAGQLSDQSVTNWSKSPFPGKPSGSHLLSSASTLFQTPFSVPLSYSGSLASSIKLLSSISA